MTTGEGTICCFFGMNTQCTKYYRPFFPSKIAKPDHVLFCSKLNVSFLIYCVLMVCQMLIIWRRSMFKVVLESLDKVVKILGEEVNTPDVVALTITSDKNNQISLVR